ncbi:MAG TPA: transglutaminase-like domain-containing protein [Acidimicrobiales bacterium]
MDPTARFGELVRGGEAELAHRLDEAALVIAAHAQPDLDVGAYLGHLDAIAAATEEPTVAAVLDRLFRVEGFGGDTETYYDPRNSYLDQVIDRRRGIPITLSLVVVEVGRRLGVTFVPIGIPGHFLVRYGDSFVDAFEGGRVLTLAECEKRFDEIHAGAIPFGPAVLDPARPFDILSRMLANLRQIHLAKRDSVSLEWVLRLRGMLPGMTIEERAERAGVLAALGRFDKAADLLEELAPEADEAKATALTAKAKQLRARLN